jgi:hypothetical protein
MIMLIRVREPKVQEHEIRNVRKGIGERLDSRRSNVVAPEPHNSLNSSERVVFAVNNDLDCTDHVQYLPDPSAAQSRRTHSTQDTE